MDTIDSIEALEALYDAAVPAALTKVATHITPLYREWIEASRFTILSTVGPEGTDASPRGDDGPVVRIADAKTLHLADWRGQAPRRATPLAVSCCDPTVSDSESE